MTKCADVKFQYAECPATSPKREISAAMFRACVQNVPGKIGEASHTGCTHGKSAQGSTKDQVAWFHLRPDLTPWRSRRSEIDVDRGVIGDLLGLMHPRPSPEEKRIWKLMNVILQVSA